MARFVNLRLNTAYLIAHPLVISWWHKSEHVVTEGIHAKKSIPSWVEAAPKSGCSWLQLVVICKVPNKLARVNSHEFQ